ncbi:hypothetical protein [uncultured Serinicoccus sp.]|uniref:hypothetical protein n=1 Tax=uncultured Serinicoccus sp. TaxID=735514 RepID=UPI0026084209|nr:hypothetical protein [uncultured Serinicoccus sp.]
MRKEWQQGTFGDLVQPDIQKVDVQRGTKYPIVGVLGFGRGLLHRDAVTTESTRYKQLHQVRPGQLIYSKLKAFEGAITVVPAEHDIAYASPEFPTYRTTARALPKYVQLITQRPALWADLAAQSKGVGGRRERLNPRDLLSVPVQYPQVAEQRRIVDLVTALDDTITTAESAYAHLLSATELMRDVDFSPVGKVCVSLDQLCSVDGSLVKPTGSLAELPHVGAERIVSGTGDLVGVVSAREDGVTSGKYRFDDRHVIYSKIRPNLRKVAVPDAPGLCSADAYPLLGRDGVPRRYLQQLLLSSAFTEVAASRSGRTKMPKINRTELMSIEVRWHAADEMAGLAGKYDALTKAREGLRRHATRLRNVRSNLLTALLSGEHEIPESYDELMEDVAA